ncbi:MAG TPA: carbohydrate binding domain-containing protein [Candidatus Bathyarchaeia archaeon]|nr:carbohydrate binding domain-containing protein [Candidatus Bathyarchaeia archaeon]
MLRIARIEVSLQERSRSLVFLMLVSAVSLLLAAECVIVGSASSFERPSTGRLISVLDRDDPQLQHRLGQVVSEIDPEESARCLRRATELSRYSRLYWSDLASACQSTGDTECADRATEQLVKLCPKVPYYHQLAAESYLRKNQLDESLEQFQRLLELDPTYATDSWAALLTVFEPDFIFQKVASRMDSTSQVGFVDFLSTRGEDDAAYRIWGFVAASDRPFPFSSVQPYLERLISLGRIEEGAHVWQNLVRLGLVKNPGVGEKDNLVFNGDFEQLPLNAGFDWRAGPTNYLALDFAAPRAYHGAHCLRLDFRVGRNNDYEPVYQIVPVHSNRSYSLKAYVRSQDITSTSGPCLRVSDTRLGGFEDAVSETTVGTTEWHPVSLSFSTGPETQSVRLSLWRPRGRSFPMEISGSFWMDSVTLQCKDCTAEK